MSTITTLQTRVRRQTNTDTTSYTNDQINDSLTEWAHLFTSEILDAQDCWDFQGEIAYADLEADQREYTFPTNILKIKRIDLKLDGTNWVKANWVDESEIATSISSESDITDNFTNEKPYISLFDKSLFILSGTITNVTGGIKIWYTEEIVGVSAAGADLTAFSAGTDKPNIAEAFQKGLVYGSAKDWFDKYDIENQSRKMDRLIDKITEKMRTHYGKRSDRIVVLQTASSSEGYE
jgi:hypothetical protein